MVRVVIELELELSAGADLERDVIDAGVLDLKRRLLREPTIRRVDVTSPLHDVDE